MKKPNQIDQQENDITLMDWESGEAIPEEYNDIFDFNFDPDNLNDERFVKPPLPKPILVKWHNAQNAAAQIVINLGCCYFGIIHGRFIFGDLLEALMVGQKLRAYRVDISTLSMSQDNVDSLRTLLEKGYLKNLNLIISDYFYFHERNNLIPYLQNQLDIDDRFQLAVCRTHTKITTAHFNNGIKLVIHGSANLRSSGNIEQIMLQDSPEMYDYMQEINDKLIENSKTINHKSKRRNELWQVVQENSAE